MGIHTGLLLLTAGFALGFYKSRLFTGEKIRRECVGLFCLAAFLGNVLGLVLTLRSGRETLYPDGLVLPKKEGVSYTEELNVRIGSEKQTVRVVVPARRAEEEKDRREEAADETEPLKSREKEILSSIAASNEEHEDDDYYYLPSSWEGEALIWIRPGERTGVFLALLCFGAGILLVLHKIREEDEKRLKRSDALLAEYPGFIMKLTLLLEAGMTPPKAFLSMVQDYRRNRDRSGEKSLVCEEIAAFCHELESGVSEGDAYQHFGERCAEIHYRTLASLLSQNRRRGSRQLCSVLEREAMEAFEERKRRSRVQGETAGTRLLVPMTLMLVIVMAIILVPAYLGVYR